MLKLSTKQKIADAEAAAAEQRASDNFRAARLAAVESATVSVNGNLYDANERAIQRMSVAVVAYTGAPENAPAAWSMADTPPGVMTAITVGELREALRAAVEQLGKLWAR
jgi:hypothetical protein